MPQITNPILPGFNPDPAICRRGDDIYIATSTFEWWPGVQIHHSRDLVNWRLACRPLERKSQLDLTGVEDSGGVWAPCLTWAHDQFWLVYTNVLNKSSKFFDTPNYVVTAPEIEGPWSDPVAITRTGFDPSFFHDEDGKTWQVCMRWSHLPGRTHFDGIILQEYDRDAKALIGPVYDIFKKAIGGTEGPHLLKRNDWYYLILAEGGTSWNHAITVARSRSVTGPYELHPTNPMLTAWGDAENPLQKCGHGGFVELPDGSWWTTHLCGRPLPGTAFKEDAPWTGFCILGRETGIQRITWGEDDWPYLAHGGNFPKLTHDAPDLPAHPWPEQPTTFEFDDTVLPSCFQSPRTPVTDDWCDLTTRPGYLRITGGSGPVNRFEQHTLARRITSWECSVSITLEADPAHFQHEASLLALYDCDVWYSIGVTKDRIEEGTEPRRVLRLSWNDGNEYDVDFENQVILEEGPVELRFKLNHTLLEAWWRQGEAEWSRIGGDLDATRLSDEYEKAGGLNFTGSWFGIQAMDLAGDGFYADFDRIEFVD